MSVKPRGKGFEAYVSHKDFRKRKTFDTYDEAVQWENRIRLLVTSGQPVDIAQEPSKAASWTLKDAFEECYRAVWRGSKAEKTTMINVNLAESFFGKNTSLSAITTQKVQEYVDFLVRHNRSNATINRRLAVLSKALHHAERCGHLEKMPYIRRLKESQGRLRFLSDQEEAAMLSICKQWGWQDMEDIISVLLDTGIRMGELLRLKKEDVYSGHIVLFETKNSKTHSVPLTARAKSVLEARKDIFEGELFPYDYNGLQKRMQRLVDHLSIEDVSFHTLRHTFASRLVQKGVPILTVSKLLNHSSVQVTMRYAHLAPSNFDDAIKLLEKAA